MPETAYRPTTDADLADLIGWAAAEVRPVSLRGQGTKAGFGAPVNTDSVVDLGGFSGVSLYEPEELVLTAGAGTPLAEVERILAAQGQHLAFEPPDLGPLLGGRGPGTLGGLVACNLSGPRRISAGAVRDHVLGLTAVSGRGEAFKTGGRVVKNVSGFDLCKLLTGSFGTLAAVTTVTLKVMPVPEAVRTLVLPGLTDAAAVEVMSRALGSPHEVSAAAHLPGDAAACLADLPGLGDLGRGSATLVRLEGPGPSVDYRSQAMRDDLAALGTDGVVLHTTPSRDLWAALRDLRPVVEPRHRAVWRLSVTPMAAARVVEAIARQRPIAVYYDWGGGLIWLATEEDRDAGAGVIRDALRHHGGGHATLVRASAAVRAAVPVFSPQPPAVAALEGRIRAQFDPAGILNPGRMAAV